MAVACIIGVLVLTTGIVCIKKLVMLLNMSFSLPVNQSFVLTIQMPELGLDGIDHRPLCTVAYC